MRGIYGLWNSDYLTRQNPSRTNKLLSHSKKHKKRKTLSSGFLSSLKLPLLALSLTHSSGVTETYSNRDLDGKSFLITRLCLSLMTSKEQFFQFQGSWHLKFI